MDDMKEFRVYGGMLALVAVLCASPFATMTVNAEEEVLFEATDGEFSLEDIPEEEQSPEQNQGQEQTHPPWRYLCPPRYSARCVRVVRHVARRQGTRSRSRARGPRAGRAQSRPGPHGPRFRRTQPRILIA